MSAAVDVTPCLWLDGTAEEAVRDWVSLVPGSRIVEERRSGGAVLTIAFELAGRPYLALNGRGTSFPFSPAVSLVIVCDDQAEIDRLWARILADGGRESRCGWITDRHGLSWQVVPRELPDLLAGGGADRVMAALLEMVKLDLAALRAAAAG
jgi:predicted 3-demethylubiquinone-9 3-methyltransferase (glyoxalase superfamily)